MSTLRVSTLANQGGTQSTAIENAINGSAKAWVNFNGTGTVAVRASYNVSSITDNGNGDYTVNFTNAMPDVNYSVVGACGTGAAGNDDFFLTTNYNVASTTSAARLGAFRGSSAITDAAWVSVAIFR